MKTLPELLWALLAALMTLAIGATGIWAGLPWLLPSLTSDYNARIIPNAQAGVLRAEMPVGLGDAPLRAAKRGGLSHVSVEGPAA